MFCRRCGKQIPDDSRFCSYCGSNIYAETIVYYSHPENIATRNETKYKSKKTHKHIFALVGAVLAFALVLVNCLPLHFCVFSHSWKKATCTEPKICTRCGKTEGSALGHSWNEATCTEPKTCTRCGETEGAALGHLWSEQTKTTPKQCLRCGEKRPMSLPLSGTIYLGDKLSRESEITIESSDESVYVKLKNEKKEDVFAFFVRANSTVTVKVPAGKYYVYFACGYEWFGTKDCFGDRTSYSKDNELIDFSKYSITYTLTTVTNGNFSETPVTKEEFD